MSNVKTVELPNLEGSGILESELTYLYALQHKKYGLYFLLNDSSPVKGNPTDILEYTTCSVDLAYKDMDYTDMNRVLSRYAGDEFEMVRVALISINSIIHLITKSS